jgi:hypothetical protein
MIVFRTPRRIELDDGRLLFSAVSHIGGRLILAGIPYLDNPIDYDRVTIRLRDGRTPAFERFERTEYEPCLILSAGIGDDPVTLDIGYESKTWTVSPERETIPPSRLSAMTLFKHDYRLLPEYIRHYTALGVERFYLYYNGPLSEIDWTFLRDNEHARHADIVLYEWNIAYWWTLAAPVGVPQYDAQGFQHHAQTMAINHHLHAMKEVSRYTLFADLDEYVFMPKAHLEKAMERLVSYLQFQCWWMSPDPPRAYEDFSLAESDMPILVSEAGEGPGRTKCLVRVLDIDIMGIHRPHSHLGRRGFMADGYFHIYRFPGIDRSSELLHPVKPMTKTQFLQTRFKDA